MYIWCIHSCMLCHSWVHTLTKTYTLSQRINSLNNSRNCCSHQSIAGHREACWVMECADHVSLMFLCYWKPSLLLHCLKYPDAWQPIWTWPVDRLISQRKKMEKDIADKTQNFFITFIRYDRRILHLYVPLILESQCIGLWWKAWLEFRYKKKI